MTPCVLLIFKHGVDYTIIQWIAANLEDRLAVATLGGFSKKVVVSGVAHREMCCHRPYGSLWIIL